MDNNITPLDQLRAFLNKLFQFESQELDFGVYKILHYKRTEIKQFIDELLVDKVKGQLQALSSAQSHDAFLKLKELEHDDIIKGWLEAEEAERTTLMKYGKDKIIQYQELQKQVEIAQVSVETENKIYNHLTLFFSRYYDKGDFVSKRRFGKNEKYVVPYNGEETHFYWANNDQYYIKSSESFQKFAFKAPHGSGNLVVNFKLTEAETEQGNVKGDEYKYFMPSTKDHELFPSDVSIGRKDAELNIFFEYRGLTDAEKKTFSGNNKQDAINTQVATVLREKLKNETLCINLWQTGETDETLLLRNLNRYTRKNNYDFFIHKNLKGFLQRELDFYIKSELVNVDDLYVSEADEYFDRIRLNLKTIKVFKLIADTVIEFLTQIEEFQKKLWEKKKFVLNTEWVISIDRLVEYIGIEAATPILLEAISNKAQLAEWNTLFGKENIPTGKLTIELLKADAFAWRILPIDTVNFSPAFKENLLNALSLKIDLEELTDGLVMHSDNYHGLLALHEKFNNRISPIYIDPPYNTDASAIIYKNNYKRSSFLSMMSERIRVADPLLRKDSLICVAIDDVEVGGLRNILSEYFIKEAGIIAVRSNPAGRKTKGKFAPAHEYALFFGNSENAVPSSLEITGKRLERYPKKDEKGNFAWANFIRSGNNDKREDRPKLYYPIIVAPNDTIRIPKMHWVAENKEYVLDETPANDEVVIYPILNNGGTIIEKNWQRGHQRVPNEIEEYRVRRISGGGISIDFKTRMDESSLPITWWDKSEYASANYGAAELKELFNFKPFDFPKARNLVQDCIRAAGALEPESIVLDFFPGSGTTFDAVQRLNNEDKGSRKCILIEQGDYVYTGIIPRIKKVAYTFDWKDGKPKDGSMNGLGIFFKYQRLEQYEEALENIAFSIAQDTKQTAMQFEQYIPKYFLEFETQGSQTLVNTEAMRNPWAYTLKVWDGFTYDTEQAVDLVETFNYLIGLHMQKCITKQLNGHAYKFVAGHNNAGKQLLVVWRNTAEWSLADFEADSLTLREELKAFTYDQLYISGQAHIENYQPVEEIFKNKMLS